MKTLSKILVTFIILGGAGYFAFTKKPASPDTKKPEFTIIRNRLSTNEQVANYAASQGIQPPFILHFFATWCKPCNAEHPWLLRLNQKHNIPIIAVLFRDSPAAFARWSKMHEPYFSHIVMAPEQELVATLGINGIPASFAFLPSKQVAKLDFNIQGQQVVDAVANQLLKSKEDTVLKDTKGPAK